MDEEQHEPELVDDFPDDNPGGPEAGSTEGEIDPAELFSDPEDIEFFEKVGQDWEQKAAEQ